MREKALAREAAEQAPLAPAQPKSAAFGPSEREIAKDPELHHKEEEPALATPCQKGPEHIQQAKAAPCQKGPEHIQQAKAAPCQKGPEHHQQKEATPCQKDPELHQQKEATPCQKEVGLHQQKEATPCQKEVGLHQQAMGVKPEADCSPSSECNPPDVKKAKVASPAAALPEPTTPLPKGAWVLKQNPNTRVAIDWHHTLEVDEVVTGANLRSLEALRSQGYQVFLLSFCGHVRKLEVQARLDKLPFKFDQVAFTSSRTGAKGKAEWMIRNSVGHIFDDNNDICQEALSKGLSVYPVSPKRHWVFNGKRAHPTLCGAVAAFLLDQAMAD